LEKYKQESARNLFHKLYDLADEFFVFVDTGVQRKYFDESLKKDITQIKTLIHRLCDKAIGQLEIHLEPFPPIEEENLLHHG
jgi:hypothetical protein